MSARTRWVADPGVSWRIALTATLEIMPSGADLDARIATINRRLGSHTQPVTDGPDTEALLRELNAGATAAVALGTSGHSVVISAHHQHVDGLGLLAILSEITGLAVTSDARGLGDRRDSAGVGSTRRARLHEVATAPPATIAPDRHDRDVSSDTFAAREVSGPVRASELVHAAARAAIALNTRHGTSTTHITIAVGASRVDGSHPAIADDSALLRLRDLGEAGLDDVRKLLREAPTEAAPSHAGETRLLRFTVRMALRVLRSRLGSTLLVSHLGRLDAPGVRAAAFYPVTSGGSGVSIGAVSLGETTTLTARARGSRHGTSRMLELLDDVATALGAEDPTP